MLEQRKRIRVVSAFFPVTHKESKQTGDTFGSYHFLFVIISSLTLSTELYRKQEVKGPGASSGHRLSYFFDLQPIPVWVKSYTAARLSQRQHATAAPGGAVGVSGRRSASGSS